jgi:hypothetical protein
VGLFGKRLAFWIYSAIFFAKTRPFFEMVWLGLALIMNIDRPYNCCIVALHTIILSSLRAKALRTSFARSLCSLFRCSNYIARSLCSLYSYRVHTHVRYTHIIVLHTYNCIVRYAHYCLSFVALMMDTSANTQSHVCVCDGPKGPKGVKNIPL